MIVFFCNKNVTFRNGYKTSLQEVAMRKSFLAAVAAMTAVVTAASVISVHAATYNTNKLSNMKGYVISGGNANCEDELKKVLSNLKIDIENGKLDNCPTIIYPGINNKPGTDEKETSTPENGADKVEPETTIPETNRPGNNVPETEKPSVNNPETSKPDQNIPETSKPSVEDTTTVSGEPENKSYAEQVVDLVNQERVKAGLSKVVLDKNIEAAALIRAKEIEVSFSHTRPNGSSFSSVLKENNISYRGAGENIAWGQTSPEAVMNAWMNSEGHRANILNANFTKIGVGYYQNSAGRKYWTQLFTY